MTAPKSMFYRQASLRTTLPFAILAWALLVEVAPDFTRAAEPETPLYSFPYTPGLDPTSLKRSIDPCVDFYEYACGGWQKKNPIPADQPRWDVYSKLSRENERFLWGILDELSRQTRGRDADEERIGDFFHACMDEGRVNRLGAHPLAPYLARIDRLRGAADLPVLVADLHTSLGADNLLFRFRSDQDYGNSANVIPFVEASGLGLPDRAYYLDADDHSKRIRLRYLNHVEHMLELLGEGPRIAEADARNVLGIETELARKSLTEVERRDPYKLFHKVDRKGLEALAPHFGWAAYLGKLGLENQNTFNVTEPAYFEELDHELETLPKASLKSYLRFHLVNAAAPVLGREFVSAHFDFFEKTLRGVHRMRPRWNRCVSLVDDELGEALGKEFVRRAFGHEQKERALAMTLRIEKAMEDDLRELSWMSPATKARALAKLHAVVNKVGYPDHFRDYSSVRINRDDFFGDVARLNEFEARRQRNKIGKPLDRTEWLMTPPTVNAYYSTQMNDINFPAGVLEPPLFDQRMDDAPNYGNTGGTIGHELTHGFDDEGRQFDAQGNLFDWWTPEDAKEFRDRAECVVKQYSRYIVVDDVRVNSRLTEGEDVADLGGLELAYRAFEGEIKDKVLPSRDGLTPEQRFFVGYAQWACENDRPESLRLDALTDPHSPARYRVNGLVVNMPEFERAFLCKKGQPMVKENRCKVW